MPSDEVAGWVLLFALMGLVLLIALLCGNNKPTSVPILAPVERSGFSSSGCVWWCVFIMVVAMILFAANTPH